jgi:hypothetical protein
MKNKYAQAAAGIILALVMLFGATQIIVTGQEGKTVEASEKPHASQSIEGAWQTTVTQRNCQTGAAMGTFRGLSTFHEGGTISETSVASGPSLRSPGHGVWERQSPGTYKGSFIFMRFNPDGTFAGTQKITVTNVLTGNGDTFDSTASIQVLDLNNNVLFTGCATAVGTRFS